MRSIRRPAFVIVGLCLAIGSSSPADAGFWKDVGRVLTDPLKLERGTENIIHSVERVDLMLKDLTASMKESGAVLDAKVREHVERIDSTIMRTFDRADVTVAQAVERIEAAERAMVEHTAETIKCTTVVGLRLVQEALANSLNMVGKTKPRFVLFGWEIGRIEFTPQDIVTPIESYDQLRVAAEERLAKLEEKSPAKFVEFIYGDMQRVADLTRCHYASDNGLQVRLRRDIYDYRQRHLAWVGLVQ